MAGRGSFEGGAGPHAAFTSRQRATRPLVHSLPRLPGALTLPYLKPYPLCRFGKYTKGGTWRIPPRSCSRYAAVWDPGRDSVPRGRLGAAGATYPSASRPPSPRQPRDARGGRQLARLRLGADADGGPLPAAAVRARGSASCPSQRWRRRYYAGMLSLLRYCARVCFGSGLAMLQICRGQGLPGQVYPHASLRRRARGWREPEGA